MKGFLAVMKGNLFRDNPCFYVMELLPFTVVVVVVVVVKSPQAPEDDSQQR